MTCPVWQHYVTTKAQGWRKSVTLWEDIFLCCISFHDKFCIYVNTRTINEKKYINTHKNTTRNSKSYARMASAECWNEGTTNEIAQFLKQHLFLHTLSRIQNAWNILIFVHISYRFINFMDSEIINSAQICTKQ